MAKNYSAAELTRMQELGSAWIFRRALNDNINYRNPEDIVKDKKYHELVSLYPAINKQWIDNCGRINIKLYGEINGRFTKRRRSGTSTILCYC
jgi:hypothetical protein